jgi:hypothetical protein
MKPVFMLRQKDCEACFFLTYIMSYQFTKFTLALESIR